MLKQPKENCTCGHCCARRGEVAPIDERPALIAEVERLREAGEKLQDEALAMADRAANLERERDALREACEAATVFCTNHGGWFENDPMPIAADVLAKCNAALAGQP